MPVRRIIAEVQIDMDENGVFSLKPDSLEMLKEAGYSYDKAEDVGCRSIGHA